MSVMSDAEIRRRKRVQGHISQATATLGLAALATRGGASAVGRLKKVPKLMSLGPKLKEASNTLTTTGAGIGGVGGYNFAAYTNAESKKRKPVAKAFNFDRSQAKQMAKTGATAAAAQAPKVVQAKLTPLRTQPAQGPRLMDVVNKHMGEVSKFGNWKTIDQRERTQRRDRKAMKWAGGTAAVGAGLGGAIERTAPGSLSHAKNVAQRSYKTHKLVNGGKIKAAGRAAQTVFTHPNPNVAGLGMSAGLIAGGVAAGLGAAGHHKYNQTRINARRRANYKRAQVKKTLSDDLIFKAYDPERQRQKRLDRYSTGSAVASGALGAASALKGKQAFGQKIERAGKVSFTGLRSKSNLASFKGGLKNAGVAAGLAGASAGALSVSNKIRNRKKGTLTRIGS